MWAERERWRQRVRVCVFVVAVSTLVTAWWRYDHNSRSMPALLSPLDKWISDSAPPDSRATPSVAASPNSNTVGGTSGASGVGTTGRGANPDVTYRTGATGQGTVRSGNVSTPRTGDIDYAVAEPRKSDRDKQVPCDPRATQASKDTPQTSADEALPCDEALPQPGLDTAPPVSR